MGTANSDSSRSAPAGRPVLDVQAITVRYGRAAVLHEVSLHVNAGETVALLGANGAGKSTTLRTVSGLMRPASGEVAVNGVGTRRMSVESITRLGVAHVVEGRRVFPGLSVEDNLRVAFFVARHRLDRQSEFARMYDLFPKLYERRHQLGWSLSGGEQQMLALARALITDPQLLMLDEPSLGLAPLVVAQVMDVLRQIRSERPEAGVLLVEQNARAALSLADRVYVLANGRLVTSGTADEVGKSDELARVYLARK